MATRLVLTYGTGGLAFGQIKQSYTIPAAGSGSLSSGGFSYSCTGTGSCFAGTSSATKYGFAVGGGDQIRLTFIFNLDVPVEVLHQQRAGFPRDCGHRWNILKLCR